MREILFRGKRTDNGEWIEGLLARYNPKFEVANIVNEFELLVAVKTETVGQYTGLTDKNGKKIFEGDIVEYNTFDDFDCYSVVKIGRYSQDGSGGEYSGRNCIGVYVEVNNFTCPDWAENDPSLLHEYLKQQNLNEVAAFCEVIGNIHDNLKFLGAADE